MSEEEKEYINLKVNVLIMASAHMGLMAEIGTEDEYEEAVKGVNDFKNVLLDTFGAV